MPLEMHLVIYKSLPSAVVKKGQMHLLEKDSNFEMAPILTWYIVVVNTEQSLETFAVQCPLHIPTTNPLKMITFKYFGWK